MDKLEKILENLPKPKLSLAADLKIKLKLYYFMSVNSLARFFSSMVRRKLIFRNSLAVALIIIIIFSGTSIYAYGNNEITPGTSLYALKRVMEKVEERMSLTDVAKVQAYQKFSGRRLEEALHLSQERLPDGENVKKIKISGEIQKNIDEAVNNIISASNKVEEIKDEAKLETAKVKLRKNENERMNYLDEIKKNASLEQDNKLIEKINQAKEMIGQRQKVLENRQIEKEKEKKDNIENEAKDRSSSNNKKQIEQNGAVIESYQDKD